MGTERAPQILEKPGGFQTIERLQITLQHLAEPGKIQDVAARQNRHNQPGIIFQQHDAGHLSERNIQFSRNLNQTFTGCTSDQPIGNLLVIKITANNRGKVHEDGLKSPDRGAVAARTVDGLKNYSPDRTPGFG